MLRILTIVAVTFSTAASVLADAAAIGKEGAACFIGESLAPVSLAEAGQN